MPRELWEVAAHESDDAVFGIDARGGIASWTRGATRLFGHHESDVIGQPTTVLVVDNEATEHANRVRRALAGERLEREPARARRRDGLVVPIELTLVPLSPGRGLCAIARDMTERHVAQVTLAESESRLQEAQRLSHVGLWVWDAGMGVVQMSDELYRIHGIDPLDFDGRLDSYLARVHPDDRPGLEEDLQRVLATGALFEREYRIVGPDHRVRWVYHRGNVEFGEDRRAAGMRGIAQDITDRKEAADTLRGQAVLLELLRGMAVAANEAGDLGDALYRCIKDFCRHSGWHVGHAVLIDDGRPSAGDIWHLEEPSRCASLPAYGLAAGNDPITLVTQVMETIQPVWVADLADTATRPPGPAQDPDYRLVTDGLRTGFGFPVVVGSDLLAVVELFSRDRREPDRQLMDTAAQGAVQLGRVVERDRSRQALSRQALYDALTGLPNRSLFLDRLTQAVHGLGRRESQLAVIFIDLDNFKLINDSLGHDCGDRLLTTVAQRLEAVMRPGDTAARFGGDEFVILCDRVPSGDDAIQVAARLLRAVAEPVLLDVDVTTVVSGSAGIVVTGTPQARPEDLVRDADSAMYRAKEEGGGRFHVFDSGLHQRASRKLALGNELRTALEGNELYLVYQPQVCVPGGELLGVEALVRWQNPLRGSMDPDEFISVAEETQLIVPMGNWILGEACRQAAAWQRLMPAGTGFTVCVNVSAVQLGRAELVDAVTLALAETGMRPSNLCIEITESVLMSDSGSCLEALLGLKLLGVSIAMDDFGTGYSSLAYLSRFPIDVIKIDRAFIENLGRGNARAQAIVRAVVDLSNALGVRTVAEGVETEEQLQDLVAAGCAAAQGFLFSRPCPPDAIAALLGHLPDSQGRAVSTRPAR